MLIDFHMHLFPDALAERTIAKLAETSSCTPYADGTLDCLRKRMDSWGVDLGVSLHIATKPSQQTNVNNFAVSVQSSRLVSFGSVHPDAPDALEELERIKALGLKGVKLHPDYQGFFVDDPRVFPLYQKIARLGLPLLLHCGWDPVSPQSVHTPPEALARVLEAFPQLTVVGAHLGGMKRYDEVEKHLAGKYPNLYIDISMSPRYCTDRDQFRRILNLQGAERVLFGTDCPWGSAPETLDYLFATGLTQEENEQILFRNAQRLLGL